ncbi:hypothetical protein [Leifsonia sp. NPDC058248]|uniref:hypothetical protein n=1 Tax=Leifsonia sp. NPDC058248 TaxID=3346402 RepID=UPI0036DA200D
MDADDGLVFTGDHVLPTIHPGLGLGGETATSPIADYLESLERIAAYDDLRVCPGHEYVFSGLAARCASTAEHHLRRSREVAARLQVDEDLSIWQVASELTWTGLGQLEGLLPAVGPGPDGHASRVRSVPRVAPLPEGFRASRTPSGLARHYSIVRKMCAVF